MTARCFLICLMLMLSVTACFADDPKLDGLVDAVEMKGLSGKPAVLHFMNGTIVSDVKIVGFIPDRGAKSIRFLQYQDGLRKPRMKTSDLYRVLIDGRRYAFRYHGPTKTRFLINLDAAKFDAEERMRGADLVLRELQGEEEMKEAVAVQKKIFDDARKKLSPVQFNLAESESALVFTDYPLPLANQLALIVDGMCQRMNSIFGLPKNANIWTGKIMIAVLSKRDLFGDFEAEVMNNHNFGTSTTIYHSNSRRFMVVTYRKEMGKSVAMAISWSMAGGYVGRYRSNAPLPPWIYTGLQSNLNRMMFPQPATDAKENQKNQAQLRRTGSLLGMLDATRMEDGREHLARMLVGHLMKTDPTAFSQFFEDVKLGHTWQSALKTNYGATPEDFAKDFGRKNGVPGLKP